MKITDDRTVRLSVRELVEFVLRGGDIDTRRGTVRVQDAMLLGANAHRRLQAGAGDGYSAEVSLRAETVFRDGEARLITEGRADGLIADFDGERNAPGEWTVDEIKGIFRDIHSLEVPEPVHLAQAQVYAYMVCSEKQLEQISVRITYVQLEEDEKRRSPVVTDEVRYFVFHYTARDIRDLFLYYTALFEKWALFLLEHRRERKSSVQGFGFPYPYRPGQKKIAAQAYRAMEASEHLFVQAPTGIGKTLAMLFPAVQAAGRDMGERIFYLTAKNAAASVAEEGMRLLSERGLRFSCVRITAKEKVCAASEMRCDPVHCERAKGHFDRVGEAVYDLITHESTIGTEELLSYAAKYRVCPYEFSLDVSSCTDVIIGDYNYAFSPHAALQRYFQEGVRGDYIFLIDEAHNLVDRAREMYSAELTKEELLRAKKLFEKQKKIVRHLERANRVMLALKRECAGTRVFDRDSFPNALISELMTLREEIALFMDRNPELPGGDEAQEFFFRIGDILDTAAHAEEGYLACTGFTEDGSFRFRLFCIDPSKRLKERLDYIRSAVFFSATLLPIRYYKELLTGNREEKAISADSPFDPSRRRILIGCDVSTKYTRRGEREYERIAAYLSAMVSAKPGHYLAFFPSHSFLSEIQKILESDARLSEHCRLIFQKRGMSEEERTDFLRAFSEEGPEEEARPLLGLAVMGGMFSEGIDLKREALIGVAAAGTGLPQVCEERELIRRYYEERQENGFDFAYRFPGFNKVQQAAGRLIRTPEDRGIILLLDERFRYAENRALFPRDWNDAVWTDLKGAEAGIREFWDKSGQFPVDTP